MSVRRICTRPSSRLWNISLSKLKVGSACAIKCKVKDHWSDLDVSSVLLVLWKCLQCTATTFWSFTSVHYKSAKQTTTMNLKKNQNKNKSISFALSVPWRRCLAPRSCCWRTWRESLRTGRVLLDQSQGLTGFPQDPPRIGPAVLTHCGETHVREKVQN